MKRMITAMSAAALALSVSLAAQTATTTQPKMDKDKEMTITGCLEKNKSGGFWLTNAMNSIGSATTGTSSTTTGSTPTGTTGAATTTGESKTSGMTFNLEGGHDLDKHVGHKISVTGHAKGDMSGDEVQGTTGPEVKARDFDVKSIKMIAATCS